MGERNRLHAGRSREGERGRERDACMYSKKASGRAEQVSKQ